MNISVNEIEKERKASVAFLKKTRMVALALKLTSKNELEAVTAILRRIKDRAMLEIIYREISHKLTIKNSLESVSTDFERLLFDRYKYESKFQICRQIWIGNCCADLFIPAFGILKPMNQRGFLRRGVVVEVDGAIHNDETKMKKDLLKETYLFQAGIEVWRINNDEVRSQKVILPHSDRRIGILDSRARRNLWGRIHLQTVLANGSIDQILGLFDEKNKNKIRKIYETNDKTHAGL